MKTVALGLLLATQYAPLHGPLLEKVRKATWHHGCPVPPEDLRELRVRYRNYQGKPADGILIVNAKLAPEIDSIFRDLYRKGFQIQRMEPVENFGGDDIKSMEANNTSSFNCRDKTGMPGQFSNHSWGRAIDINPLTNPYVTGEKVLPEAGRAYLDRTKRQPGGSLADDVVVKLFESRGWTWGGRWRDRQDYQHFEKPK